MERPGIPRRELCDLRLEVGLGYIREKPHRHEPEGEGVVDHGLRFEVRKTARFEALDFAGQAAEVFLEAENRAGEFHPEVESRRVLAPERDHVAPEGQVVADEDGKARAELDGHGLVVCSAKTEGGTSVRRLAVGEL